MQYNSGANTIAYGVLSEADKEDLVQQLLMLTKELEKTEREPKRVQRFWIRINETAPAVASILSSAARLAQLLGM